MSLTNCGSCKGCTFGKASPKGAELLKIALAGNPNVGKSIIFNALTGFYAEVSNYPGTTLDSSVAITPFGKLIDTPGIYGLGSVNQEEVVAKDIIFDCDTIVNVVSALSLERDLFLTLQLIDMEFPVVVVINQCDEALARGIKINVNKLANILGVRVISTVATKNKGIDKLKTVLMNNCQASCVKEDIKKHEQLFKNEHDIEKKELIYSERRKKINKIVESVMQFNENSFNISEYLGDLLLNPAIGALVAVFILWALYEIIGVFISGNAVDFLENGILLKYYSPFITKLVGQIISYKPAIQILTGEFGLLTMTVQYVIGILLPLVLAFNIFMALLEDSGYLPRLAVITDKMLKTIGLNGRAIIPVILGFGCVTMAAITTRMLGSERERTIATAILGLVIPCSAQLGIIVSLLAVAGGLKAWIIYLAVIFSILAITGTFLNRLLPGESSHLFIDLPPLRFPMAKNVIKKTYSKTTHFLYEATPLFFLGSFIISVMQMTGVLGWIQKILAPLTVNLLHLPVETANIFIMGLIRRDFGAAGLSDMAGLNGSAAILNSGQIIVSLVVITLFVPCIASVAVMFKERGWKEALLIWMGSWICAFSIGTIVANIFMLF